MLSLWKCWAEAFVLGLFWKCLCGNGWGWCVKALCEVDGVGVNALWDRCVNALWDKCVNALWMGLVCVKWMVGLVCEVDDGAGV